MLDYGQVCECCAQSYAAAPTWGRVVSNGGAAVALVGDVDVADVGPSRVVAFRGSMVFQDWLMDAMFARVRYGEGHVHRGFLREWQLLRRKVLAAISGASRVVFVGHSSGGSICSIAALDPGIPQSTEVYVATLAAPAAGDAAAARQMERRITRHVRVQVAQDIVPRLLPQFLGYVHAGSLVPEVADAFKGWSVFGRIQYDHAIATYRAAGRQLGSLFPTSGQDAAANKNAHSTANQLSSAVARA